MIASLCHNSLARAQTPDEYQMEALELDELGSSAFPPPLTDPEFIRGDCNGDGWVNVGDAVTILSEFIIGPPVIAESCLEACDSNGDGMGPDVSDTMYIIMYRFMSGSQPPLPFPDCDSLPGVDCFAFLGCP